MGQVISSCLRFLGVDVKRDEETSLIFHEQGPIYCFNIYPDNDATLQPCLSLCPNIQSDPLLANAVATVNENPVVHMPWPCSEFDLYPGTQHEDGGSSSILCLDKQNETTYIEEIKDVIIGEQPAYGSEAEKRTKEEIENDSKIRAAIGKKIAVEERRIGHYTSSQKILLVGEGDFSFAASLAVAFTSATNMVATSLDSQEFLIKNYGSFPSNWYELMTRGSVVLHGVDATKMAKHPELSLMKFDRVVYNFPHAGFKQQESPACQIRRHQKLVRGFLKNAKKLIEEGGQIHVTHKSNPFFLKWDIPKLGTDQGLSLIEAVKFKLSKYPGYHTKYGFGGDKDFDCIPSKTYKFALTS